MCVRSTTWRKGETMRTRKRYYATTSGHAAGIDFDVRAPDGSLICSILGLAGPDEPGGIEDAKAKATLVLAGLNTLQAEKERKAKRRIRKTPRQGYTYSRGKNGV